MGLFLFLLTPLTWGISCKVACSMQCESLTPLTYPGSCQKLLFPQLRIKHKDPHAAAECEWSEKCATQSSANHGHTSSQKKALLYAGQTVSVINNDRALWLHATLVCAANHGYYIIKVIGGAEYR